MEGKFKADRRTLVASYGCDCCQDYEWQEAEFNTLQDAYDYVEEDYNWNIYLDNVLILKK